MSNYQVKMEGQRARGGRGRGGRGGRGKLYRGRGYAKPPYRAAAAKQEKLLTHGVFRQSLLLVRCERGWTIAPQDVFAFFCNAYKDRSMGIKPFCRSGKEEKFIFEADNIIYVDGMGVERKLHYLELPTTLEGEPESSTPRPMVTPPIGQDHLQFEADVLLIRGYDGRGYWALAPDSVYSAVKFMRAHEEVNSYGVQNPQTHAPEQVERSTDSTDTFPFWYQTNKGKTPILCYKI